MKITYWGGGYVGLTGAVHFARAGHITTIYDPDPGVIGAIVAGKPKANGFLNYIGDTAAELVAKSNLRGTTDLDAAYFADVHILAVPTEREGEPYDALVIQVVCDIHKNAPRPTTILIESTLTPGTTAKILTKTGNVDLGKTWFLAVCPRRDWFADNTKNLETLTRIVGGATPPCTSRAIEVLKVVSPTILATTAQTAEITKALENALLHVPVVMAHQLAAALPDHDIAEALDLASTHWRFASMRPLYLGAGTGGRCVPLGTRYLAAAAGADFTIGHEAIDFDAEMRGLVTRAVVRRIAPPATVCVLGIAYRPNFRDAGLSPGLDVARGIKHHAPGLAVTIHDPMWTRKELEAVFGLQPGDVDEADTIILVIPHAEYRSYPLRLDRKRLIFDCQGAWAHHAGLFRAQGTQYVQIGTPGWR